MNAQGTLEHLPMRDFSKKGAFWGKFEVMNANQVREQLHALIEEADEGRWNLCQNSPNKTTLKKGRLTGQPIFVHRRDNACLVSQYRQDASVPK